MEQKDNFEIAEEDKYANAVLDEKETKLIQRIISIMGETERKCINAIKEIL